MVCLPTVNEPSLPGHPQTLLPDYKLHATHLIRGSGPGTSPTLVLPPPQKTQPYSNGVPVTCMLPGTYMHVACMQALCMLHARFMHAEITCMQNVPKPCMSHEACAKHVCSWLL